MEQADAEDGTVIVVLMGVSGSGKTTVGRTLADDLGWTFLDADDFHPPANVAKMAAGVALSDEDRWPWLDRLVEELRAFEQNGRHVILACSALKQSYRDRLAPAGDVRWVYLKGEKSTIEPRIASRESHYMPASLLTSQFAALEEPAGAMVVDIRQSPDAQAAQIAASLRSKV
ncbi:MAG TPA: gluconokinase [Casimicrobiaceae bacterium]|nr:gluconokinase [Casimicrobiaceae bacterium]